MMPTLAIFHGAATDLTLRGPGVATFDLSSFDAVRLWIQDGELVKSTASGTAVAEVVESGRSLLVHFTQAEAEAITAPGDRRYSMHVQTGGVWFDVGGIGQLQVRKH